VNTTKNVLIITDGAKETAKIASAIAAALGDLKVEVKAAGDFMGNDILPADVFFLGCENPEPETFAYLADVLRHINLAGRLCGIFSPKSEKAVQYLSALVHDCEVALHPEPLFASSVDSVKTWAQNVVSGSFCTRNDSK